jgi:signal transduction histidine kinase
MFGRIHPQTDFEGTGIGLSIVRSRRTHGWLCRMDSALGKGSKFWIELPQPATPELATPMPPHDRAAKYFVG